MSFPEGDLQAGMPSGQLWQEGKLFEIKQAVEPYIRRLNYEVFGIDLFKSKSGLTLRFLVDRPEGGISLQECAALNEQISGFLDRENILEDRHILEVSSPGIDSPLAAEKDFLRVAGRQVRVLLAEPIKAKTEVEGAVVYVRDNCVYLKAGNEEIRIPLSQIKKAKQVIK